MLDSTPVHIAYANMFLQKSHVLKENVDVSADRVDDGIQINFRMDIFHIFIIQCVLNFVIIFLLILSLRK